MQEAIHLNTPVVKVKNEPKTLTIKFNKQKLKSRTRRIVFILIYALLFISIGQTYISGSPLFYPLAQVGLVLSIIAFLNRIGKQKNQG